MKKVSNKKIVVLAGIVLVAVIIGISYAYLSITLKANKENIVKVADLNLILDESSNNGINLTNTVAVKDEEALAQKGATFSLKNNGKAYICYQLYLDDSPLSTSEKRIDDKYIKYSLDKDNEIGAATTLPTIGDNPNRLLDEGTIASGSTISYQLRLWLNSEIDGNYSNQVFKGKLRVKATQCERLLTVSEQLLNGVGANGAIDTSDSEQTFITGTNPNNYIWYSGKLWRAVSIDPSDNSVKLVTQWNISSMPYNYPSSAFEGSYAQTWLNDTTVDGFLGNLRDYKKFIKTDSTWNTTQTTTTTKPTKTTMVTSAVGLLNVYEYTMSYKNATASTGYLNNGLFWWALTPYDTSNARYVDNYGKIGYGLYIGDSRGLRPSINLKSSVEIVSGTGTESDPYRLKGDKDTPTSGTKLATRYSGEYIRFGTGDNNLYQIVSHETTGTTKIVSTIPLKENGSYKNIVFDSYYNVNYSSSNTIGTFLNGDYLTSGSYLTTEQVSMIEDNTTWYLGTVGYRESYKLAKYASTTSNTLTSNTTQAKVGLLRLGELNAGQFEHFEGTDSYWILTSNNSSTIRYINNDASTGLCNDDMSYLAAARPVMNLKSNVVITSGDGTKENPFEIVLDN